MSTHVTLIRRIEWLATLVSAFLAASPAPQKVHAECVETSDRRRSDAFPCRTRPRQNHRAHHTRGGSRVHQQVIFPTLARAEQLMSEKKIVAGGAVVGRVSLRFIIEAESPGQADQIVSSLPVWVVAETRVTPLIALSERRNHVQQLLDKLK